MERALKTYDIVANIIQSVDSKTLANCVYVCELWSEIALDVRWRAISNIGQATVLLKMVGMNLNSDREEGNVESLREGGEDERAEPRPLDNQTDDSTPNWQRFLFYSHRVRMLHLYPTHPTVVDDFASLASSCPLPAIFPTLRELWITILPDRTGSVSYLGKFSCSTLRRLVVNFRPSFYRETSSEMYRLEELVDEISMRAPHIKEVTVYHRVQERRIKTLGPFLALLLPKLSELTHLKIKSYMELTAGIMECVMGLKRLSKLELLGSFSFRTHLMLGVRASLLSGKYEHAFSSLRSLTFEACAEDFTALHRIRRSFKTLEELDLTIYLISGDDGFKELFTQITDFDTLQRLELTCRDRSGSISLNDISSLGRLKFLTSFKLTSDLHNSMTNTDLVSFVRMCPSLLDLRFAVWSTQGFGRSRFTLEALVLLSRHANSLRRLWLGVDWMRDDWLMSSKGVPLDKTSEKEVGRCLKDLIEFRFFTMWEVRSVELESEDVDALRRFLEMCLDEDCVWDLLDYGGIEVKVRTQDRE